MRIIIVLVIMSFCLVGMAHAGLKEGLAAYEKRQFDKAIKQLVPVAEKGNIQAQRLLGMIYYEQKDDSKESVKWYEKAASAGDAKSQYELGMVLRYSEDQDGKIKAFKWMKKAAEQGYPYAQSDLGFRYMMGTGVKEDHEEGKKWMLKAAEQGYVTIFDGLATAYSVGKNPDLIEAYKWCLLHIAHDPTYPGAKERMQKLASMMIPSQIQEAKRRAQNWRPKSINRELNRGERFGERAF